MGVMDHVSYEANAISISPGDRIILYTDGLIEIKDSQGKILGTRGFSEIVGRCAIEPDIDRMKSRIIDEIEKFSGKKDYDDDVTLLCLELMDYFCQSWLTFDFNIDEVTERLIAPLSLYYSMDDRDIKGVKIAIYEALTNAIEHGNLDMPAFLRYSDPFERAYERFKEIRQSNPKYRNRKVTAGYLCHPDRITYFIKDEGSGFDHKNIEEPTSPENITRCHGRGIAMMKMYMDEIYFNDTGNEIRLVKKIRPKS